MAFGRALTLLFVASFNIVEGASGRQASRKASYSQCTKKYGFFHFYLILFSTPKGRSNPINLIGMNARVSSAMIDNDKFYVSRSRDHRKNRCFLLIISLK